MQWKQLRDGPKTYFSPSRERALVVVQVGAYGLDVWMSSPRIDCLCIGSISNDTFFSFALQRLKNAWQTQIRVLKKARASPGNMFELELRGVRPTV